ncbi:MAG TPA: hypothetical protein VJ990_02185 [Clostridia bacterium]|nr:hypothetical protein [Clostridia bacterium]
MFLATGLEVEPNTTKSREKPVTGKKMDIALFNIGDIALNTYKRVYDWNNIVVKNLP